MTRPTAASLRPDADLSESARGAPFAIFREVLSAYIVGQANLTAVRHELINCVAASHDRAVSMLHYLRAANQTDLITNKALHILVRDVQAAVDVVDQDRASERSPRHSVADKQTLLADRFQIGARAGKGGIGEVFVARDLRRVAAGHADARVAIKIIQRRHSECRDAIRSLQREAVNAQCLVHPGIRRVYELDREQQRFFLVMEWLDGETLAARLDRTKGRPMAADAFRAVLLQVTSALSFAHRHGIVHGDIKPGNVFVTTDSSIKLLDFGHTEGIVSSARFEPFAITRGYSSVEVSHGSQPQICDDVYSVAVMLYRMLVGRRPFGRHTAVEAETLGLQPHPPSMLSRRQWRVLRTALALRREDRLATVAQLRSGLLLSPVAPPARPHLVVAA